MNDVIKDIISKYGELRKSTSLGGAKYSGTEENPYLVLISSDEDIKECEVMDGCKIIADKAFDEREELSRISIPKSVEHIGYMAFYACASLKDISFSEGLKVIDDNAFCDCNINELELPRSIKHIGRDAFSIAGIKKLILPDGVTFIGQDAFSYNDASFNEYCGGYYWGSKENPYLCFVKPMNSSTESITLSEGCKVIYSNAFIRCKSLKEVNLPEGLIEIGHSAFKECCELGAIHFPESIEIIDTEAFASCKNLKKVIFGDSTIEIGSSAFSGCESIEEIKLGCATVGDNAFEDCKGLKRFTVGAGSNLYGYYIFSGCTSLSEVIFPKNFGYSFDPEEFEGYQDLNITYV